MIGQRQFEHISFLSFILKHLKSFNTFWDRLWGGGKIHFHTYTENGRYVSLVYFEKKSELVKFKRPNSRKAHMILTDARFSSVKDLKKGFN